MEARALLYYKEFAFLSITQKTQSLASYWWEYTISSFKENARTFSKNSTTETKTGKRTMTLLQKIKFQTRN